MGTINKFFFNAVAFTGGLIALFLIPQEAAARVWYVQEGAPMNATGFSWASPIDLFTAMGLAATGDEVWVKAGYYSSPDNSPNCPALLYGGFSGNETSVNQRNITANPTILHDRGPCFGSAYRFVTVAYIDGFIIENANTGALGCTQVKNCVFRNNHSTCMDQGTGDANFGGALYTTGNLFVDNCIFENNSAPVGGAIYSVGGNLTIKNSVFVGSASSYNGGSIYAGGGSVSLTNCTFVNNSAGSYGSAIYADHSVVSQKNCIFWGGIQAATAPNRTQVYSYYASGTSTNCLIEGGVPDEITDAGGNVFSNPLFTNANDFDGADNLWRTADDGLNIRPCSPAYNSGTNALTPCTDILGGLRSQNGAVDMGAYEQSQAALTGNTINIAGNQSYCGNGSTIITASAVAGQTYNWSNGANGSTVVLTSGLYMVTVTDINNCSANTSITITQNTLPSMGLVGNTAYCGNGGTLITATGGNSYTWSNGATTAGVTLTGGIYTVTATNTAGCTASSTVAIMQQAAVNAVITGNGLVCNNTTTTLTASGGIAYSWNTGSTSNMVQAASGVYIVTVTGANSCSAVTSFTVVAAISPQTPTIASNTMNCNTTTLTAAGNGNFVWSNGTMGTTNTVTTGGTYTVTLTDTNGCTASTSTTVTQGTNAVLPFNGTSLLLCNGATVIAAGAPTAGVYTWSNGSHSAVLTVTNAGVYAVTITDASGCNSTGSVTVVAQPTITASASTVLAGTPITLTATSGFNAYQWFCGTSPIPNATQNTLTVTTAGNYTVVVSSISGGGCTASASQAIYAPFSVGTTPISCANTTALIPIIIGHNISSCTGVTMNLTISGAAVATNTIVLGANLPQNATYNAFANGSVLNGVIYLTGAANINLAAGDTLCWINIQLVNAQPNTVIGIAGTVQESYSTTQVNYTLALTNIAVLGSAMLNLNIKVNNDATKPLPSTGGNPTTATFNGAGAIINTNTTGTVSVALPIGLGNIVRINRQTVSPTGGTLFTGIQTYYMARILLRDPSFMPNVFQIIAADVDFDSRITANDLSEISRRIVGIVPHFLNDWTFIDSDSLSNVRYQISTMYPLSDGTARYYANQIPQPSQQNIIPVTAIGSSCTAASQNLAAIMIGDVLNNWTPNDAPLFRPSAPPTVVLDIQNAALSNGWWTIPVSTGSSSLHAVDIKGLTVQDSVKLELGSHFETVDNTINGAYYATSFYKDYEATNIPCTAFCIKVKGVLPSLSGFQNTIYIDGELATVSTGSCFTPTQEIQEGGVLIVSPNPTNGGVTVTSETNITRIIIYNAIGQVVLENIVNDKIVKVDMGKQDTGIYMLQVFNENGQKATEKIVIQR